MTIWCYRTVELSYHGEEDSLNELGQRGWELVGVTYGWAYLKRREPAPACAERRVHLSISGSPLCNTQGGTDVTMEASEVTCKACKRLHSR